jgi:hypothetical protein
MTFLPDNYQKPVSNSKYLKLAEGDNRIRILSSAIVGWLDWDNKQPIRTKERPEKSIDPAKPAKHFWAFMIWDYAEKTIKILEVTQATIQNAIYDLHSDTNWGDPKGYDLNIKRTGKDMNTEYSVIPTPPRELHPEIKKLYEAQNCDLNALYEGLDPFTKSDTENASGDLLGGNNANLEVTQADIDAIPW